MMAPVLVQAHALWAKDPIRVFLAVEPGEYVLEYTGGYGSEHRDKVWEPCGRPELHPNDCWCDDPIWRPKPDAEERTYHSEKEKHDGV